MKSSEWLDRRRFERLVEDHAAALQLFAQQWTGSPEDCLQEALIQLLELASEPDDVVAWLFRVVRNRAIDLQRIERNRRRREQSVGQRAWFEPGSLSENVDPEKIQEALLGLDESVRRVIVARIWGGLSFEQVAEVMEMSVTAAHRTYHNGLAKLKYRLEIPCANPKKCTR